MRCLPGLGVSLLLTMGVLLGPSAAATAEPSPSATTPPAGLPTTTTTTTSSSSGLAPGRYRLDIRVRVTATVPVLGEQTSTTHTITRLDVDEGGARGAATACQVRTEGPGFVSSMPPETIRRLPVSRFPIEVKGRRIRADMGAGTVSYRDDRGVIPSTDTDPRVFDLDGDGKPGARLDLDLGALGQWKLQIVSRGHTIFAGDIADDGTVKGRLEKLENEERILSGLPVQLPERPKAADLSGTSFVLRPWAARDNLSCPERP